MNVIYLDTETTGKDPKEDRLIQLAYKVDGTDKVINELFNPGFPISFGAMCVHHITNEMVEDKPDFQDSEHKQKLIDVLQDHILVAHNAPFDVGFIKKEGIEPRFVIDTYKVAYKYLTHDQNGEDLQNYKLQYLRYALDIHIDGATAHDALGDILVLEKLFLLIFNKLKNSGEFENDKSILTNMINVSNQPLLLRKMNFGKHYGKTFAEVAAEAPDYLEWLSTKTDISIDMRYTIKYYLNN